MRAEALGEAHPLLTVVVFAPVEVERDEPLHPPARLVGQQHGRQQQGRDEDGERHPEHVFRDLQIDEQPAKTSDGQQVGTEDADDHRAINHRARDSKLGLRQPSASQTHREHEVADQEGGGAHVELGGGDLAEERHLAQDVEPHQEDSAKAEHEVFDPTPRHPS